MGSDSNSDADYLPAICADVQANEDEAAKLKVRRKKGPWKSPMVLIGLSNEQQE
jgi:hypothetical protein